MFLGNTLGAASSGLDSVERQLATLSQNVANASTPNYVRETTPLTSIDSGAGGPGGVRTGGATREIDVQLQANLFASVAKEAGSNVAQSSLAAIDGASGTPGSGQDLPSLVGDLQDAFTTLGADPSSTTQQSAVLDKAQSLVDGIHALNDSLTQAQQKAQSSLSDDVSTANSALSSIGTLSNQIIVAKSQGQSTAGLEDQRDGQMKTLAQLTGAKFNFQANGDVQVIAANTVLPTRGNTAAFGIGPSSTLQLNGSNVSGLGGEMGAYATLSTTTIPALQRGLDGFAQSMASSFQTAGMTVLTDGAGNVPASGAAASGFATTIQVSAAYSSAPSKVRDGDTGSLASGDNSNIQTVLNTVFSSASTGVPAQATNLIAGIAAQATQAGSTATANTALRTGLESRMSAISGVSVDSELSQMVQLQAAYAANAKVVSAVQNMWTQLLEAVQ